MGGLKTAVTNPAHPRESGDPGILSSSTGVSEKSLDPRLRGDERIKEGLALFVSDAGPAPVAVQRADIDRLFVHDSVEAIFAALAAEPSDWAKAQLETLQTKSPQTLKVAFRQLREGARMASFADEMAVEYRIGARVVQRHDFLEGVRAVIVDKDNAPRWDPASLEGVTDLDGIFAPLPADEEWHALPVEIVRAGAHLC